MMLRTRGRPSSGSSSRRSSTFPALKPYRSTISLSMTSRNRYISAASGEDEEWDRSQRDEGKDDKKEHTADVGEETVPLLSHVFAIVRDDEERNEREWQRKGRERRRVD